MFFRRILIFMLAPLMSAGCVRLEEKMTLRGDGSGHVQMSVTFPQLGLRWLPGKPDVTWIRPHLPDGVRLDSFASRKTQATVANANGKKQTVAGQAYEFRLDFDAVTRLNQVRIQPDRRNMLAATAGGTPGNTSVPELSAKPAAGPFQHVELKTENGHMHFKRIVQAARSPEEIEAAQMAAPGSAVRQRSVDLSRGKMTITIECPGELVEHNAHRVDGQKLTWEFNLDTLQKHQDRNWIVEFTCRSEAN